MIFLPSEYCLATCSFWLMGILLSLGPSEAGLLYGFDIFIFDIQHILFN